MKKSIIISILLIILSIAIGIGIGIGIAKSRINVTSKQTAQAVLLAGKQTLEPDKRLNNPAANETSLNGVGLNAPENRVVVKKVESGRVKQALEAAERTQLDCVNRFDLGKQLNLERQLNLAPVTSLTKLDRGAFLHLAKELSHAKLLNFDKSLVSAAVLDLTKQLYREHVLDQTQQLNHAELLNLSKPLEQARVHDLHQELAEFRNLTQPVDNDRLLG